MTPTMEERDLIDVWVVEDDRFLRDTIQECLNEEQGMVCGLAVESCEEALAALGDERWPLVLLLDLGLPGMGGLAGIEAVRRRSPKTEVVILTIHDDDHVILEAVCAGASGYLLKPLTPSRIVDAVRAAAGGGSPMSPSIARKVLTLFNEYVGSSEDYGLTDREREVLQLLTDEKTQREIASELFLSAHTVDNHVRSIYRKLHVQSRTGAVVKALKERLL